MSKEFHSENFSLEALRAGDRTEYARLVDAYSGQIYRLALKMLEDAQDAEDVLQETFIKAFAALPAFEGRSSLSTWLYRIALNESLMILRKRRPDSISIESNGTDDDPDTEPVQIVDWGSLPEEELLSSESKRFLDEAVYRLPDSLRTVFVLRDIQGLSIRDTAEALNISEMNVKTRLLRARLKLREVLSSYFGERLPERRQE